MTDVPPDPAVPPALQDDKTMPIIVYACYIAGWVTGGVSSIVGLILAYVSKASAPEWLQSHYVFAIRTFWLSLLGGVIGCLTLIIGIGALILIAVGVWVTVRAIVGLSWLLKGEAYPTPRNWML
ncbi:DUF4870 family protein [Caulobacter endophyticus]|uniref:DUF4870 domain-containing protein n=1 Tax=Caulobacter endophyticus TaxID=2172652 RepID=A0A2T9JJE1_9CAUL|nr:hypothetical protein [Caulobacter endophyticus]PVM83788.1 hypothetical protein DDF67_20165 [Caulobacter endophyticus]